MSSAPGHSDAEVEAALERISRPGRLDAAQQAVSIGAPQLQRILGKALEQGGWFDGAHEQAVRSALAEVDAVARERAVRTLIAEETRVGMFVGVAVGLELARELPGIADTGAEGDAEK